MYSQARVKNDVGTKQETNKYNNAKEQKDPLVEPDKIKYHCVLYVPEEVYKADQEFLKDTERCKKYSIY